MRYGFAKAYAKLNLTLDILGILPDGYHNLEMVMQSVSLCDSVAVRIGCGGDVSVISNIGHIPNDERNIAVKAARAFISASGKDLDGIAIAMEKRIPSSAGMAGGSADGAAVLRLLNELSGCNFSDAELCEMGLTVGADVPFCLMGGTSLARGKGERLTELGNMPDCHIVISKPWRGMSTKAVFSKIDSHPIQKHPDTKGMLNAINNGNLYGIAAHVYNVFESVVSSEVYDILTIKRTLRECGALCAAMTGSGSAVFGIFQSKKSAENAKNVLKRRFVDTFITKPIKAAEVRKCTWISQD